MRKSRLRSRSLAVAVIASLLLALGPAAARAEDSVDDGTVAASDNETPNGWFVELTTPPTSDGTSSVAVAASQDEFRAAAKGKGVSYEERFAYGDLWTRKDEREPWSILRRPRPVQRETWKKLDWSTEKEPPTWTGESSAAAKGFLDFVKSDDGKAIIEKYGYATGK